MTLSGCVVVVSGCNEETRPHPTVEVDPLLTLRTAIGGDPLITGVVTECDESPDIIIFGNEFQLMTLQSVTLIKIAFGQLEVSDDETRQIFQVLLPS